MHIDDLSESEISVMFDRLLHAFEKWVNDTSKKNKYSIQSFELWIEGSGWLNEFSAMRREWIWLLNLPDRSYCARIDQFSQSMHDHFCAVSDEVRVKTLTNHPYCHLKPILNKLALRLQSSRYKRIKMDKMYQEKQRIQDLHSKLTAVSVQHSRLLPFRFELYYHQEYLADISSVDVREHLEQFVHLMKTLPDFPLGQELLFYTRVVEQGTKTGHFHTHFLVILNGKYHRTSYAFFHKVRCIWQQVTEGKGYAFVSPTGQESYAAQNYVMGKVIQRGDRQSFDKLLKASDYIAKIGTDSKSNQYLRIKGARFKAFTCSDQ